MKFTIFYIAAIVVANLGFSYLPMIELPFDQRLAPMSFLVGFIFVLRDFAQKEVGHKVWFSIAAGVALSYVMADPFVASASATAFLISEFVDWSVYTVSDKPMKQRVILSSCASAPVDSAVFMIMLGFFSWFGLLVMIASKMVGALIVWKALK